MAAWVNFLQSCTAEKNTANVCLTCVDSLNLVHIPSAPFFPLSIIPTGMLIRNFVGTNVFVVRSPPVGPG